MASIYHVPLHFHREGLDDIVLKLLHLEAKAPDMEQWETHHEPQPTQQPDQQDRMDISTPIDEEIVPAGQEEYEDFVRQATGRDYGWFFDVYLRQAALPELVETRDARGLSLAWKAPGGGPFPMPVEVSVDGQVSRVAMADGKGFVPADPAAHIVVDPMARVLKRNVAVEEYQAWQASRRATTRK